MSRKLSLKSLFTSPTLMKSLSGDTDLTGTDRYCLSMWERVQTNSHILIVLRLIHWKQIRQLIMKPCPDQWYPSLQKTCWIFLTSPSVICSLTQYIWTIFWVVIKESPILWVDDHLTLHFYCNMSNLWSYSSSCTCSRSVRPIVEDLKKVTTFLSLSKDSLTWGSSHNNLTLFSIVWSKDTIVTRLPGVLRCENRPANRPASRETGLEMPCWPASDLLWVQITQSYPNRLRFSSLPCTQSPCHTVIDPVFKEGFFLR